MRHRIELGVDKHCNMTAAACWDNERGQAILIVERNCLFFLCLMMLDTLEMKLLLRGT